MFHSYYPHFIETTNILVILQTFWWSWNWFHWYHQHFTVFSEAETGFIHTTNISVKLKLDSFILPTFQWITFIHTNMSVKLKLVSFILPTFQWSCNRFHSYYQHFSEAETGFIHTTNFSVKLRLVSFTLPTCQWITFIHTTNISVNNLHSYYQHFSE